MPNKCCVYQCSKSPGYGFPKNPELRKRWIVAVRRDKWTPKAHSVVCADHFRTEDFFDGPTARGGLIRVKRQLRPGVVPSVFKWRQPSSVLTEQRQQRLLKREEQRDSKTTNTTLHQESSSDGIGIQEIHFIDGVEAFQGTEIEVSAELQEVSSSADPSNQNLPLGSDRHPDAETQTPPIPSTSTSGVQVKLDPSPPPHVSVSALQFDQELLHYYTGLESFPKFEAVFLSLGPAVNHLNYVRTSTVTCISPINQFLLMLAKLRQDLDYLPLSRLCGVSVFTAENVFLTWVNFCSRQWGEIDLWLPSNQVRYFAPSDFKRKFPTTRVVLDGTEIPVEKPSNPSSQRATFSTYKNRNTVKALIGCTPGGLISYVSDAYGGSASDRQIIERSGLPDMCDRGDSVMADKGFNVQDLLAAKDVQVNIPAFFKRKNRLTEQQVLDDRKVSSKRVHIERLIGMGKTYKMLVSCLNASETRLARHIIFVCFFLCNFRRNIVSEDA